jgi:hypothetical protein
LNARKPHFIPVPLDEHADAPQLLAAAAVDAARQMTCIPVENP